VNTNKTFHSTGKTNLKIWCGVWPLTKQIDKRLITFENKILSKICSPIFDKDKRVIRYNNKYTRRISMGVVVYKLSKKFKELNGTKSGNAKRTHIKNKRSN